MAFYYGYCSLMRNNTFGKAALILFPRRTKFIGDERLLRQEKDNVMTKISSILAVAIILASASIASAATVKAAKHHRYIERGAVMLLENNGAHAAGGGTSAAEHFQNNWNIGY